MDRLAATGAARAPRPREGASGGPPYEVHLLAARRRAGPAAGLASDQVPDRSADRSLGRLPVPRPDRLAEVEKAVAALACRQDAEGASLRAATAARLAACEAALASLLARQGRTEAALAALEARVGALEGAAPDGAGRAQAAPPSAEVPRAGQEAGVAGVAGTVGRGRARGA